MTDVNVAAEITRDEFEAYEDVRASGVTNMYAVDLVCDISGLDREQCFYIMKHYSELVEQYPGVVDN